MHNRVTLVHIVSEKAPESAARCVLQAANLTAYLSDPTLVATVFVPTNDAFTTALSQYGVTPTQALAEPSLLKGVSPMTLSHAVVVEACFAGNDLVLLTSSKHVPHAYICSCW